MEIHDNSFSFAFFCTLQSHLKISNVIFFHNNLENCNGLNGFWLAPSNFDLIVNLHFTEFIFQCFFKSITN